MADVITVPQKLDGATTANPAGPPLVDLSKLDATTKTAQAKATDNQAAATDNSSALLANIQLVDKSTAQVADASQPAAAASAAVEAAPAPQAAATTQVADNRPAAAASENCDKSDACSFTPTTDREKSKAWWDARAQRLGVQPEKDANCLYTVKFGDDLSTIAQRQLQSEGKAVNAQSLKDEQDKIIKLNDAQYKSLDCNPHFLKAGWRLNLDDSCTKPAPEAPAPQPAPEPAPQKVEKAPCPQDAPPPPPRPENCEHNLTKVDPRHCDHLIQTPGHQILINHGDGCPPSRLDVPPGKSIIYIKDGHPKMITVENQDGTIPQHSEILYGVDQHGRQFGLSEQQKDAYYQRFECAPQVQDAPAPINDTQTYSTPDTQAPTWQQDSNGQYFYQSEGKNWYRDQDNHDYFADQQGRHWYEDDQNRYFYVDQGHCWYRDNQGRDYFNYNNREYFRDRNNSNQLYYEYQGQRYLEQNQNIYNYNTIQNFYGAQGPAHQEHLMTHQGQGVIRDQQGRTQDRFSTQEQGANSAQALHDAQVRQHEREERAREQATREQAAKPAAPVPAPASVPAVQNQKHIPTAAEINAMKTEQERTQARTEAAAAIQAQHDQQRAAIKAQQDTQRRADEQKQNDAALKTQQDNERKAHEAAEAAQRAKQAPPPVRQAAPAPAPTPAAKSPAQAPHPAAAKQQSSTVSMTP